jgi:tRNA-2-methylthio-N6-dimethylallyladenosine synthase
MNERDSEAVSEMLRGRGYSIVQHEEDADVVLLNTCSVREQAEQKAIGKAGYLKRRLRKNPNFILGVMGCMAQNRGEELIDKLPDIDLIIGTQKFHQVPDHLDNIFKTLEGQGPKPSTIVDLENEQGSQNTIVAHNLDKRKVSAFISIMQGCNMNCTFCIVPKTRGRERCRPIESIVEEAHELVENGTKEITLLGQIVNSYGRREIPFIQGKSPFVQLLERLNEIKGLERIRFTSPHPRGFKQDLVEAYRDLPKLCEYIHLPMQSGSSKILKKMNRPYSRERFKQLVGDLRSVVPDMYFSTDIIVGFPGETDQDFELTRNLFEEIGFEMAFIFKYSTRTGTPAAILEDQIPKEVKEERNQILLSILEKASLKRNQNLIGTTQEILVEGPARKGENMFVGRNRGFRKVVFSGSERLIGELVPVKIEEASVTTVRGSLVIQ